jgi:hypothetical protein
MPHKSWLSETDHDLYKTANKQSHYNLFGAFLLLNLLSYIARKAFSRRISSPKLAAQAEYGIIQFVHSAFAVAAAVYTLTHRHSLLDPNSCDTTTTTSFFCFDRLTSLFLDIHAGYLFYEWIFYLMNEKIIKPRFDYLGLHRTLLLLGYALAKAHPVTLTVIILPLYQLLAVAQIAEARLDLSVAFSRPPRICLDRLWYVVFLSFFRAVGALAIAFYSWWWIISKDLIHLDLPAGKRAVLNTAYCYIFVGGGFGLALLYLNWFRAAGDSQKRTYARLDEAAAGRNKETSAKEAEKAKSTTGTGPAKKKKKAIRA